MKRKSKSHQKGVILVLIGLVSLIILFCLDNKKMEDKDDLTISYNIKTVSNERIITENEKIDLILKEYEEKIVFYANTFQIDTDILKQKIKNDFAKLNLTDNNINVDKALIDYLFTLEKKESNLFDRKITPCNISKDEMLKLINYFSHIYGNVDFSIAAGIAHIESGYIAKGMLNKNNIFGGMSNGKLISYRNIKYGILKYIQLLSEGYFAKGLTNVEAIGKVYNPVIIDGNKKANPSWVKNVNLIKNNYTSYIDITNVSELNI